MLKGYKTYIMAGIMGVTTAVHHLGYIDGAMYSSILGLTGAGGLAALRDGMPKPTTKKKK